MAVLCLFLLLFVFMFLGVPIAISWGCPARCRS